MRKQGNIFIGKTFHRRAVLLGIVKACTFVAIFVKVGFLQIFRHRKYQELSDRNRYKIELYSGLRGNILDRNNQILASSTLRYKAIIYNEKFNYDEVLDKFMSLLDKKIKNPLLYKRKIKRDLKAARNEPIVLQSSLSPGEVSRIEFNLNALPGIEISDYIDRYYPLKNYTFHLLGYLGIANRQQLQNLKGMLKKFYQNKDHKIGQIALEKYLNKDLTGKLGVKLVEVDASGYTLDRKIHKLAEDGKDFRLSIDSQLQAYSAEIMGNKKGSVLLSDIHTGELLVFYSSSILDPNEIVKGMDNSEWQELLGGNSQAFLNRCSNVTYPPGSIFKIVSALAMLQQNCDLKKTYFCTGFYPYGNRVFHCHLDNNRGHGSVNFETAFARSCNCYFYHMASTMNPDDIYKMAIHLGLGQKIDLGCCTSLQGIIPNKAWKKKNLKKPWYGGETLNMAIGQGYLTVTPIQLITLISRVASGKFLIPTVFTDTEQTFGDLDIAPEHLIIIRNCLEKVFSDVKGTSHGNYIANPKFQLAGKTGSAQVVSRRIKNKDMFENKDKGQEHLRPHGLFTGYAPFNNPKYAVSVVVENGISGGSSALPVAKKVLKKALTILNQ